MGMYKAGFSILEIAKLLGLGVGEVKSVVDKHQGE
jgi:DNA-directed RNA polymerase specialized sigma24 family protein